MAASAACAAPSRVAWAASLRRHGVPDRKVHHLPLGIGIPAGELDLPAGIRKEDEPMEPDQDGPVTESERLRAETGKLEAERTKLLAEARRLDNNATVDVVKLVVAVYASRHASTLKERKRGGEVTLVLAMCALSGGELIAGRVAW